MGIKGFFPWMKRCFPEYHQASFDPEGKQLEWVYVIIDLTGEWRNIGCLDPAQISVHKSSSSHGLTQEERDELRKACVVDLTEPPAEPVTEPPEPRETKAPEDSRPLDQDAEQESDLLIDNLTRFYPVSVLAHLNRVIAKSLTGVDPEANVVVWIVTDDARKPVPIKEQTRAHRRQVIKKRLEETKADTVSYKHVSEIREKSLVYADGHESHSPIIADVFCNGENRPFRVKLAEWLVDKAGTFRWDNATRPGRLQLNFVTEGIEPRAVFPMAKELNTDEYREAVVRSLKDEAGVSFPKELTAEADVYIQHLVRFIAHSEASNGKETNIIVSAVDSDICALLIAWTMDHLTHRHNLFRLPKEKTNSALRTFCQTTEIPTIGFFRYREGLVIDVNGIAQHLASRKKLSATTFLAGCILTGTDFFKKETVLPFLGSEFILDGVLTVSRFLDPAPELEDKKQFEEIIVAAILAKLGMAHKFESAEKRTLRWVREYFADQKKAPPKYVPDERMYQTLKLDKEDPLGSYHKIPAAFKKRAPWPTEDAGSRSPFQAFLDNFAYWKPVWSAEDSGL